MEWYYADGDEQRGPISESVLVDLVEQGVVRADTLVWNPSMSDWLPYSEVQAQSDPLHTNPTVATSRPAVPVAQGETEPLAIASLVLGILSCGCGCLTGIPAIICGHMALNRIKESGERLGGRPLAIVGLVFAYVMLVLSLLGTVANVFFTLAGTV